MTAYDPLDSPLPIAQKRRGEEPVASFPAVHAPKKEEEMGHSAGGSPVVETEEQIGPELDPDWDRVEKIRAKMRAFVEAPRARPSQPPPAPVVEGFTIAPSWPAALVLSLISAAGSAYLLYGERGMGIALGAGAAVGFVIAGLGAWRGR